MKTKKQIQSYVRKHRGDFVSTFFRDEKEYVAFRDNRGRFTGWARKEPIITGFIKRYNPQKVKIKFRLKGERKKREVVYKVYNKKQAQEVLFRMNKKLRDKPRYKGLQKRRGLPFKRFREDAVPFIEGKNKIDLLTDKYKFKPVEILEYEGVSP